MHNVAMLLRQDFLRSVRIANFVTPPPSDQSIMGQVLGIMLKSGGLAITTFAICSLHFTRSLTVCTYKAFDESSQYGNLQTPTVGVPPHTTPIFCSDLDATFGLSTDSMGGCPPRRPFLSAICFQLGKTELAIFSFRC